MIVMGMRVQHDDRQMGQLGGKLLQIADAHASVEQRCPLVADNEVTDDFFRDTDFTRENARGSREDAQARNLI
jgi:hypothetical protein